MKKHIVFIISLVFISNVLYSPDRTNYGDPNFAYKQYVEFEEAKLQELRQAQIDLFLLKLGKLESNNNWKIYNPYGYMGEWQLGEMALRTIGYEEITFNGFKENPESFPRHLQKEAVIKLMEYNGAYIDKHYAHYIGKYVNGVLISKAGLLAAAHLGGNGSLGKFLKSNGTVNKRDAYNTSIKDYLQQFSEIQLV